MRHRRVLRGMLGLTLFGIWSWGASYWPQRYLNYTDGYTLWISLTVAPLFAGICFSHYASFGDKRIAANILMVADGTDIHLDAKSVASGFPIGFTVVLIGLLFGLAAFDWWASGRLTNQIYGLAADGVGGVLLARESLRLTDADIPGGLAEQEMKGRDLADRFWGMMFLLTGFIMQGISVLSWGLIYKLLKV